VSATTSGVKVNHTKSYNGDPVDYWPSELVKAGTDPATGGHMSLVPVVTSGAPAAPASNAGTLDEMVAILDRLDAFGEGVSGKDWLDICVAEGITENAHKNGIATLKNLGRIDKHPGHLGKYFVVTETTPEAQTMDF
jgi:hypothetical protein